MDDIYYGKILNRIIQGRLRLRLGDLVLFIYEPDKDLLEESYEIYEDAKMQAYFSGSYIKQEVLEILLKYDMWSPLDDREADDLEKKIEDLKVHAFKSFFKTKELIGIKRNIRNIEKQCFTLRTKKLQLDHLTCEGVASFARQAWIVQRTTKNLDNSCFDFSKYSVSYMMEQYQKNTITQDVFRKIARMPHWRSIWNSSKQRGDIFGKSAIELDSQQLALNSYSIMYDNVYESPEAPNDKIIDDDDCLDGWFITQKRKREKEKKQSEIDNMLSNSKIANSQEIFLVANDQTQANEVYDLNDPLARQTIRERQQQIHSMASDGTNLNFKDLSDVKNERMLNAFNSGKEKIKRMGK